MEYAPMTMSGENGGLANSQVANDVAVMARASRLMAAVVFMMCVLERTFLCKARASSYEDV